MRLSSCVEPREKDMDIWKYFGLTHRLHTFMNPMSEAKFDRMQDVPSLNSRFKIGRGQYGHLLRCHVRDHAGAQNKRRPDQAKGQCNVAPVR